MKQNTFLIVIIRLLYMLQQTITMLKKTYGMKATMPENVWLK